MDTATGIQGQIQGTGCSSGKGWSEGPGVRAGMGISRPPVHNYVKAAAAGKLVVGQEPDGHAGANGLIQRSLG